MRVELCGARLVYQQNVEGLIHTIVNCIVGSGDELYEYYNQQIVEYHLKMINSHWYKISFPQNNSVKNQTSTTASTCIESSLSVEHLLHGSFPHPFFHKSIQEKKRYYMKYFFPQTKFFGWFKNQNKKDKVAVKIPVNMDKDKKWMGLAMFVVVSISEKASCHCFEYEIQTKEKIISTQRHSIPTEVVEYSNQILFTVFEPRYNWYPYDDLKSSSFNHVYINFNTNGERMRVELCGARLVYQQNVEGLIHTIVNCIVGSGDELYEYYNQQIVEYHLKMINSHCATMEVGSSTPLNYSSTTYYEYDVFINFSGEDTRNTIVGYLYEKLHKLGLITFMDDKILSIGEDLDQKLVEAIEKSKFYIIVLSENYASSEWCLRELGKILERTCGITNRIFPVFYHVDPSDVRHQSEGVLSNALITISKLL
ncbi:unnamed protein product [Citrullus colocynthis]|uniref:ADP-ribosyl cyclase/cyclic ADP-ribose hydrolase n=1 Tax=Citrullus colocynthis TaxID=252529 RepID=A0ABP0Y0H8_9ROSI